MASWRAKGGASYRDTAGVRLVLTRHRMIGRGNTYVMQYRIDGTDTWHPVRLPRCQDAAEAQAWADQWATVYDRTGDAQAATRHMLDVAAGIA